MSRLHPWFSGCSLLPVGNKWSPHRRNVRRNRLCGKHSSTPDPWAPLTVLLYEATGTLQMEKEDHPGLSGWPHLIAGTPTAEGATGGKWDVTLKTNRAHGKQKECGWPLRGELSRWRRASKETGASVPQLQGINFRQHSNEPGGQFILRASRKKQKSTVTLILILQDSSRKASPTTMYSDFWSTELWWNKWALFQVANLLC